MGDTTHMNFEHHGHMLKKKGHNFPSNTFYRLYTPTGGPWKDYRLSNRADLILDCTSAHWATFLDEKYSWNLQNHASKSGRQFSSGMLRNSVKNSVQSSGGRFNSISFCWSTFCRVDSVKTVKAQVVKCIFNRG